MSAGTMKTTSTRRAASAMKPTAPPSTDSLSRILQPVTRELDLVTQRLLDCLQTPVAKLVAYLITAGGKRMRPALVLLAGRSGDARTHERELVDLATAVELVHTATLVHDDIIDRSPMRRQQQTFHERFGTERAVLMGDYLYASAFSMIAGVGHPDVMIYMASVCQEICRGEFQEVECRYNLELREEEYLEIVRDKTASLIAACCHLGAQLSGAAPEVTDRVTRFGWDLGMAFQIVDDCLDLTGDEETVGKALRSDLEKGSLSLPLIYLAKSLTSTAREFLFAPVARKRMDRRFLARIAKEAARRGAIDRAMDTARGFAAQAAAALADTDEIAEADAYRALADYAIQRMH